MLLSLVKLMFSGQAELVGVQASCLTHLVEAVPDLTQGFPRPAPAEILMKIVISLPMGQLTHHKLETASHCEVHALQCAGVQAGQSPGPRRQDSWGD